jgi:hypothetical protein
VGQNTVPAKFDRRWRWGGIHNWAMVELVNRKPNL